MTLLGTLRDILRLLSAEADRTVLRKLALAVALVVASGLLAALSPLAIKHLIDSVAERQATTHALSASVAALGAVYLLALCGGRLLTEIRPLVYEKAMQRLHGRLSRRFFQHLLDLRLEFHLGRRTGALGQTLSQALLGCQLLVHHAVNSFVPAIVEVVAVAIVLMNLDQPALVATFVATAVAYLVIFARSMGPLTKTAHELSSAGLSTQAVLTDSLLNCETIKYFNAEVGTRERYESATGALEMQWGQWNLQRLKVGLAVTAVFSISVAVSLMSAASAVADGSLSIGGLVLANLYMLQIVRPLETLGAALRDVSQAIGFVCPLLAVLDQPTEEPGHAPREEPRTAVSTTASAASAPSLCFEDVGFGYNQACDVLTNLNLDIAAGHTVAVVGASGAGKSSLVRLILRLYEPQRGRVLLDGVPVQQLPVAYLRSVVGLVPQDAVLFNDTIAYNIGIGKSHASRLEIEHAAQIAQLHDFISSLPAGYETVVGERGLKLSGGERQRIAIARAVIKRPRLYVFDEATSSLDSQTEAGILRNLRDISAGCTTLMIAHRLTTVLHADEIVVLDEGQVAERGTHAALLRADGVYARLWLAQLSSAAHQRETITRRPRLSGTVASSHRRS